MLNAHLPQPFCSSVVGELEADGAFKLLILERETLGGNIGPEEIITYASSTSTMTATPGVKTGI